MIAHPLDFMRIPDAVLVAIDYRSFQFLLQPVHFIVRILHILSASLFFGLVWLLDLRLAGFHPNVPLKTVAGCTMPWLYRGFWMCFVTGLALFFYDPVHVGNHAYFSLKMLFMLAGMANAWIYQRIAYANAFSAPERMPRSSRIAGMLSLLFWTGAMVCACLDSEAAPKVLLR
jgi:hypothetical protein